MSENIEIRESDGVDVVRFAPEGVCSKLMSLKIKDGKVLEMETVGGCSGNLKGIGSLILGMNIDEVIEKLQGIPCGARPTSCPDQLSICLKLYKDAKSRVGANA